MENTPDMVSLEETAAPATGLFGGTGSCAPSSAPASDIGFLSEMERMPHFCIPSEESFVLNLLEGRKGFFIIKP